MHRPLINTGFASEPSLDNFPLKSKTTKALTLAISMSCILKTDLHPGCWWVVHKFTTLALFKVCGDMYGVSQCIAVVGYDLKTDARG